MPQIPVLVFALAIVVLFVLGLAMVLFPKVDAVVKFPFISVEFHFKKK